MLKILIADGTEGFRDRLRDTLSSAYHVTCAVDGVHAWELFQKLQPDLMVVDLELPQIDGLTLLRRIYAAGFRPAVIVLGRLVSDYTVDTLMQMKIGYLLRKPCKVQVAAEQVQELLRYRQMDQSPVRAAITDLLRSFEIPCELDGGRFLMSAILLMAENPSQYMTKELYPTVGKAHGKNGKQVERSIRNAIEKGWTNGDPALWKDFFGKNAAGLPNKPNNRLFIMKMVELFRTKL